MPQLQIVVVTGMSGAGRSTALHVFEDFGFFCVDNLPPPLVPHLVELLRDGGEIGRAAFGIDVRTGAFLVNAAATFDALAEHGHAVEVVFLDAADDELVHRFSATRRPHPIAPSGDLPTAIQEERARLGPLRARAGHVIDTTGLTVHDLRRALVEWVSNGERRSRMTTRFVSFGFKYGLPVDADLVFDLRYLPNPHFVPALRPKTGRDPEVASFVLSAPETVELLDDLTRLLEHVLPRYEREGKAYLTVALGCTGGQHRSVALAEELAKRLDRERRVIVVHRDVAKAGGA